MQEQGVTVDDLHTAALPIMERHGRPNDVHFSPEGYAVLAMSVAQSIEDVLTR